MRTRRLSQTTGAHKPPTAAFTLHHTLPSHAARPLNVELLYEDRAAALSATRILAHTMAHLQLGHDLKFNLWRFDVLCHPRLHRCAVEEIRDAQILILSARGNKCLPELVCHTMRDWLECRGEKPRALGILLETLVKDSALGSMLLAFEHEARSTGAQVFLHYGGHTETACGSEPEDLRSRCQPRYRHWGLNE